MVFSRKFISATKDFCDYDRHVPAPYIRKAFLLEDQPKSAEITICGLGFYELYVNGQKITKGFLAPYITNPDQVLYYDNYDIARYLVRGKNVVGLILGNGMQNAFGGNVWDFDKAPFRSSPKVALALEADGKLLFEADESFKTMPSPITFDDLRCGEHYDSRLEIFAWAEVGFDDSGWQDCFEAEAPKGEAVLSFAEPIRVTREVKPLKVIKSGEGYIYDFGINSAGVCRLSVKGYEGQKISLTYGEVLDAGRLSLANISFGERTRKGYWQRDEFICNGKGLHIYVPRFTYHGFQYVYVEGIDDSQATSDLLTFLIMHSDLKERGGFSCSHTIANRIQEMTRNSTLSNFFYFPTDCPHREKNGWTGDAAISAEHILLNLEAENSLRQWLISIRAAQDGRGALPGIVPTGGWGFAWGNGPAWDIVLVNLPYYMYKYRGDIEVLRENADSIFKYLKYMSTRLMENGLAAYGLGDWCPVDRAVYDYTTPLEVTDTLTCMDICSKAAQIFEALGDGEKAGYAKSLFERLKKGFRSAFIEEGRMKREVATQTALSMALCYGAFEEEEKEAALSDLLRAIREKSDRFDCGILGARVIFHVLAENGYSDLAYKMITRTDCPGYGYYADRGFTSLPESFLLLKEGQVKRANGESVYSLNHHFFGDVSAWFIKTICGINVNPGFTRPDYVLIAPSFIESLSFAEGWHKLPCGKVRVKWQKQGDEIALKVEAPPECEWELRLPKGYKAALSEESGAKHYIVKREIF